MTMATTSERHLSATQPIPLASTANTENLRFPIRATYPTQSLRFLEKLQHPSTTNGSSTAASSKHAKLKLSILIVGAGLGGLATAVALATRGHSVVVLERTPQLGEVGAGIQIPPNSARLLERWKVMDHLRSRAVVPDSIRFRRWSNGEVIALTKLMPDFEENFETPYYVSHRVDFHDALHQRALELGVKVVLDSHVVEYNAEQPYVRTANGSIVTADLIIAADGVNSAARDLVVRHGSEGEPKFTGFAAYRATVDVEEMKQFPELDFIWQNPGINLWIGEGRHVMTYCISAGKYFNMVLSHKDSSDPATWDSRNILSDIKAEFDGWDPQLVTIISLIKKSLKWPLKSGGRLSNWVAPSSKLLILGDAAHAMVPYMSQGAAMAVEDGAALAVVLSKIESLSALPFALGVFEKERIQRSGQMQEASMINGLIWHFADGPEQAARDAAMHAEVVGQPFVTSANQWSDPTTQFWTHGYDAEKVMEQAWEDAKDELLAEAS